MTRSELRRRINALHDEDTEREVARSFAERRWMVEHRQSPVIGRWTVARVSGFAGLVITLVTGWVWVGGRYFAPSNELEPVRHRSSAVSVGPSTRTWHGPSQLASNWMVLSRGSGLP